MSSTDRIEDLESALQKIVLLMNEDGCHQVTERDDAVMTIALDALGLDDPPPRQWWRRS